MRVKHKMEEKRRDFPKVCFIHVRGPKAMVMSQVYTEFLKEKNIPYDLITMDIFHTEDKVDATMHYRFECDINSIWKKIQSYLSYRLYVKKILKKNKYDFVIVWSEITAVILSGILIRFCDGKYCVNVRDLFVGRRTILYRVLDRAINHSAFTTVSSEKYLDYLPDIDKKYYFIHSFNNMIISEMEEVISRKNSKSCKNNVNQKITVLFLGQVRYYSHLKQLIDEIGNDERYMFVVAGFGDEPIREYVNEKKISNVKLYGVFPVQETKNFLEKADVLVNLYGTEDINLKTALSNKVYYAICLNIPLLAFKDTYTFEMADRCGVGYAVDDDFERHSFADSFYEWYRNRDIGQAEKKCAEMIIECRRSQEVMLRKFEACIKSEGLRE